MRRSSGPVLLALVSACRTAPEVVPLPLEEDLVRLQMYAPQGCVQRADRSGYCFGLSDAPDPTSVDFTWTGGFGLCELDADGDLACARNGAPTLELPATRLARGEGRAVAVVGEGTALCVALDDGRLGCDDPANAQRSFSHWDPPSSIVSLHALYTDLCVLLDDASLWCGGIRADGYGALTPLDPVADDVVRVGSGYRLSWVDTAGSPVYADPGDAPPPDVPSAAATMSYVDGGCAILHSGDVRCWVEDAPASVRVALPHPAVGLQVNALLQGGCAALADRSIWCWDWPSDATGPDDAVAIWAPPG